LLLAASSRRPDKFLHDEYYWNANVFPGMDEEIDSEDDIRVASGGVGSAANSYMSLVNVDDNWIKLDRGVGPQSPGLGAFTTYHGRSFFATQPLKPGQEIFVRSANVPWELERFLSVGDERWLRACYG
jgi:hypothetical protein